MCIQKSTFITLTKYKSNEFIYKLRAPRKKRMCVCEEILGGGGDAMSPSRKVFNDLLRIEELGLEWKMCVNARVCFE